MKQNTNLKDIVSAHLSYLRRFSRALTGSQESGDAYVAAFLKVLIEDPDSFDMEADPRVEVYRIFCALWSSVSVNVEESSANPHWEEVASKKLDAITPRARQAFLLVAVEGFSLEELAIIMNASENKARELLDKANAEISAQVTTRVLIIEDEPIIAIDIEELVTSLGHEVVGIARTHREAVDLSRTSDFGLVLADIQLADGSSGINAVNEILQEFNVPVVFITAYPERLLTGDRPEPAFLVTKPFVPEMVKAITSQALFFEQNARVS